MSTSAIASIPSAKFIPKLGIQEYFSTNCRSVLSRWKPTAIAIVAAITTRVVNSAVCLAAFSFVFGRVAIIAAPTNGKSINTVNHFITEPPPKSQRLMQPHQPISMPHSFEQSHFVNLVEPRLNPMRFVRFLVQLHLQLLHQRQQGL